MSNSYEASVRRAQKMIAREERQGRGEPSEKERFAEGLVDRIRDRHPHRDDETYGDVDARQDGPRVGDYIAGELHRCWPEWTWDGSAFVRSTAARQAVAWALHLPRNATGNATPAPYVVAMSATATSRSRRPDSGSQSSRPDFRRESFSLEAGEAITPTAPIAARACFLE
jgi:hypothetical protein